jgi:hypothetical protein
LLLQLYKPIASHSNNKNFQQTLDWMATALEDFGVGMLNLRVSTGLQKAAKVVLGQKLGFSALWLCNERLLLLQ